MSSYLTALEHFNEHRNRLKMTTDSANLDSLIDSIEEGQYYLDMIREHFIELHGDRHADL